MPLRAFLFSLPHNGNDDGCPENKQGHRHWSIFPSSTSWVLLYSRTPRRRVAILLRSSGLRSDPRQRTRLTPGSTLCTPQPICLLDVQRLRASRQLLSWQLFGETVLGKLSFCLPRQTPPFVCFFARAAEHRATCPFVRIHRNKSCRHHQPTEIVVGVD